MQVPDRRFSSSEVASAAGMASPTFLHYVRKHGWRAIGSKAATGGVLAAGELAAGNGLGHAFTVYDALGIALARQLVDHGVEPKLAFNLATLDFSHTGDARRDPGDVFSDKLGHTLYVYSPGAPVGQCLATSEIQDWIYLFVPPMHSRAETAIVVHLNALRRRVLSALGLDGSGRAAP